LGTHKPGTHKGYPYGVFNMGQADYYLHGDWNFICDVCGFKFKASEGRRRWDGVYVCKKDYESRHPQEKRRGIKDTQNVEWTRPEATVDSFELDAYSGIVSNDLINGDVGDVSPTLTSGTSKQTQVFTTAISANRTVTLSTTNAKNADTFRIVQTATAAFTIDVGGLKTIPASTPAFVDVAFYNGAWVLVFYGILI